jgi:hypothetical protein
VNVDVRKKLREAEQRLADLMQEYDDLQEANCGRCEELARKLASGEALEGELLSAQAISQSRENIQRSAVINFEEEVVRPLRLRAREMDIDEAQAEVRRLDEEASAARERLDGFLTKAVREENELRAAVHELEEKSAKLQHGIRTMRSRQL